MYMCVFRTVQVASEMIAGYMFSLMASINKKALQISLSYLFNLVDKGKLTAVVSL